MIQLITGTPGAGKTYLAVNLLLDKYFYFNKKHQEYRKKDKFSDYVIFTNIEGLQLEHKNLNDIFRDQVPFETFFTVKYQEKIKAKYPKIIYIIDECQRFIPPRFKDTDVVFYFDYHRHFGHDIFLITQDYKKICKDISLLAEFEYRAAKRMFSLFGSFQYLMKSNGEIFARKTIPAKKEVFALFQSFEGEKQSEQGKSPLLKYIVVFALLAAGLFYLTFNMFTDGGKKAEAKQSKSVQNRTQLKTIKQESQEQKSKYSKDKKARLIKEKVITVDQGHDELAIFRDPLTDTWKTPEQINYKIINIEGKFYAVLSDYELVKGRVYHEDIQAILKEQ